LVLSDIGDVMPLLINGQALSDQIQRDGLPRVAFGDDASVHVLYLEKTPRGSEIVRSMDAINWPPPLPTDPTPQQIADAVATRQQAVIDTAALRQRILATAQNAVGYRVEDLLSGHVKALLVLWLYSQGAIDRDGKIRPLSEWIGD